MNKSTRNQKPIKGQPSSIFGSLHRGTSTRSSYPTYQHEADTTKSSPLVQYGRNPPNPPNDTTPPRAAEASGYTKPKARRTPSKFGTTTSFPLSKSIVLQSDSLADSVFIRNEESSVASSTAPISPNSARIGQGIRTMAERDDPAVTPTTSEPLYRMGHMEGVVEETPVVVSTPEHHPKTPLVAKNVTENSSSISTTPAPSSVATEAPVPALMAEILKGQSPRPDSLSVVNQPTSRTDVSALSASLYPFSNPGRGARTTQDTQCYTADQVEEATRSNVPVVLSAAESPPPGHDYNVSNGVYTAATPTSGPTPNSYQPGQVKGDWIGIPIPPLTIVNEARDASTGDRPSPAF